MTEHDLKTTPEDFQALWDGLKTAELRKDDRSFEVGDVLILREWSAQRRDDVYSHEFDPYLSLAEMWGIATERGYTGRTFRRTVTHILRGGPWLCDGYVMLSLGDTQ